MDKILNLLKIILQQDYIIFYIIHRYSQLQLYKMKTITTETIVYCLNYLPKYFNVNGLSITLKVILFY